MPGATQGETFTQTVTATGGDGTNTWSISAGSLPNGLTIAAGTGVISGTPTTAGTFNFDVTVNSGDGQSDAQTLSVAVVVSTVTETVAG